MFFALYGTWGPLGVGKILLWGVETVFPPGEYHSGQNKMKCFSADRAMPGSWLLMERCDVVNLCFLSYLSVAIIIS